MLTSSTVCQSASDSSVGGLPDRRPGVVDEDVHPSVLAADGREDGVHLGFDGDVQPVRNRAMADFGRRGPGGLTVPVENHDLGAGGGEQVGDGAANAFGAPRDCGNLPVQRESAERVLAQCHRILPWSAAAAGMPAT